MTKLKAKSIWIPNYVAHYYIQDKIALVLTQDVERGSDAHSSILVLGLALHLALVGEVNVLQNQRHIGVLVTYCELSALVHFTVFVVPEEGKQLENVSFSSFVK